MKVFKELEIKVPPEKLKTFLSQIENFLSAGWERDQEAEGRTLGQIIDNQFFYFVCEKLGNRNAALLALFQKNETIFYVSNIVPREFSSLTIEEYNIILENFNDTCVIPLISKLNLESFITSDEKVITDWISEESAELLRDFSILANKSTGSSHPSDQARWFSFLTSIVRNEDDISVGILERWLREELGWQQYQADKLALEFESGISLLNFYREN